MPERFPLRRTINSIIKIENGLNAWVEYYATHTPTFTPCCVIDPYHDRVEHLVLACAKLQAAAFELEYLKRP